MVLRDANKATPLRHTAWEKKCGGTCWKTEQQSQENCPHSQNRDGILQFCCSPEGIARVKICSVETFVKRRKEICV